VQEFRYVGPLHELEIPAVDVVVEQGGTFSVPDDMARMFDAQLELWERVDAPAAADNGGAE